MFSRLSKFVYYKLMKWELRGAFPSDIDKFIIIVAPHTSYQDFILGVIFRSVTGIYRARFLGKKELFRFPYGWFFRAMGGYPVERSKQTNMVDAVAGIFNKHDQFVLVLAPEGTREKVKSMRTGFYYIAKKARVPIVMVGFDYANKKICISEPFDTSNDFEADMEFILNYFKGIKGKNPELGLD
ncbi:MAG: 1-acyl-sn-glycerol-3-phosphate acyltransferase [Bacteroidetes bacterium]|nr:1-acyl-sn-glycerol-3-phosphate acyltransferase [Bacteroidota bacterium]MCH8233593.1 1-acyl-sn-glycerol-3-phosphate acyltransferase [Bacteroidota bacterium]